MGSSLLIVKIHKAVKQIGIFWAPIKELPSK